MDHDDSERLQQHQQQHHHHHHHHEHFEPHAALPGCPAEHISAAVQSLDTVRALHSTVVSLRSALEEAHREIDQLRKQIRIGETIESGKEFRRSQDNLSTPRESKQPGPEQPIRSPPSPSARKSRRLSSSTSGRTTQKHGSYSIRLLPEDIRVVKAESTRGGERRKPMASKIDVQIKVSSNFKVNKDGESGAEKREGDSNGEDVGHSGMTSAESDSHVDTEQSDVELVQSTSEVNIASDAKSTPTSEGENSVFEGPSATMEQPNPLSSASALVEQHANDEVDDIELIFSADEKDFAREDEEDLVSITGDYEPWAKTGKSGTPVLVNFGSIASDKDGPAKADDADDGEGRIPRDDSYDTFYPLTNSSSFLGGPGLRWTNHNVLIETDISKCGIEETPTRLDLSRRNTCPNPPSYRPLIHREAMAAMGHHQQATANRPTIAAGRTPLAVKFSRNSRAHPSSFPQRQQRPIVGGVLKDIGNLDKSSGDSDGAKRQSQSAQTEISALPEHWRSESHLIAGDGVGGQLGTDGGFYTLPAKFVPPEPTLGGHRYTAKAGNEAQEARRVLLSDINFTSMVPELSRSADHLCQAENTDPHNNNQSTTRMPTGQGDGADGGGDVATSQQSSNGVSYKGLTHLQTPDYAVVQSTAMRGIVPSASMQTTPGISQWTVNSNNYTNNNTTTTAQQNTQTTTAYQPSYYGRHDSTDSGKSGISLGSRCSASGIVALHKQSRSRSVPSVAWRCSLYRPIAGGQQLLHHHHHHTHPLPHSHLHHHQHCAAMVHSGTASYCGLGGSATTTSGKQPMGLRGSESMHYTPRVTFQEPSQRGSTTSNSSNSKGGGINRSMVAPHIARGSLPDLRTECPCAAAHRTAMCRSSVRECESSGSTDSLLDEADTMLRSNSGSGLAAGGAEYKRSTSGGQLSEVATTALGGPSRRFSENDIKRDYTPSKQSLPFLPKSAKCLKLGHLVKVISRTGRVVVGRVRYIGPVAGQDFAEDETFVGLQLPSKVGDCDGSIEGRRFFECSAQHGIFVPFKKIIMAWTA